MHKVGNKFLFVAMQLQQTFIRLFHDLNKPAVSPTRAKFFAGLNPHPQILLRKDGQLLPFYRSLELIFLKA